MVSRMDFLFGGFVRLTFLMCVCVCVCVLLLWVVVQGVHLTVRRCSTSHRIGSTST